MVFPWFEPVPVPSKILLHLVIETRLFRPQGYFPLAAVVVLNSTINIHMYFAQAIYRLNIMFIHMPVPRDTSHVRLLLFVVSQWETAKLCPKTDLRNLWVVSYFVLFSFLCVRCPSFLTNFVPFRTCAHHVFCTLFSCLSIDSMFISRDIQSCDGIFGFLRKG